MSNPRLCVGLDLERSDKTHTFDIIKQTKDFAGWYKLNPAFFMDGRGLMQDVLESTIYYIKDFAPKAKILYDAKFGDIPHTNQRYYDYVYNYLGAQGLTLNPYMGSEGFDGFVHIYEPLELFMWCSPTHSMSMAFDLENGMVWEAYMEVNGN